MCPFTSEMTPPPPPTQEPVESLSGYYNYQSPDSGPLIHLSLDALDEILTEVLNGFGAVPRRGAEVGGILLGRTSGGEIWIESCSPLACEHRRGPSFLLSEQDQMSFDEAIARNRLEGQIPVGIFRSNTREQNAITNEDRELFSRYFPSPEGAFLLVRPYASKSSVGMFLVPRNGSLPDSNADSFPFQRWELAGESAPRRRPLSDNRTPRVRSTETLLSKEPPVSMTTSEIPPRGFASARPSPLDPPPSLSGETEFLERERVPKFQAEQGWRSAWHWIPLSFLFLLLGLFLGYQLALTLFPRPPAVDLSTFALGLTATTKEDNLHIQWNRAAPLIRFAQHGRLDIQDGKYNRTVELDPTSLQTGSVMYPPTSGTVTLRFQVSLRDNNSAVETLVWSRN